MFAFAGIREYGRVERCDGAFVTTQFFHVNWLPLVPIRSTVIVAGGERRDIPLQWTSVIAGYLRTVPWLLAVGVVFSPHLSTAVRVMGLGIAALLLALGFFAFGRVSPREAAKRRVLAEYIGAPVNLAWVKPELPRVRAALHDEWSEVATRLGARGYRNFRSGDRGLVIEDAEQLDDEPSLRLAFSLARIESALAPASERGPARKLEDQLWARLEKVAAAAPGT